MTDYNGEQGSQRGDATAGSRAAAGGPARAGGARPIPKAGRRADPTEPEVPSAKRVRATRRQRSMVLVGSASLCLASIALFLLIETGRQVTTRPAASSPSGVPANASIPAPTEISRATAIEAPANSGTQPELGLEGSSSTSTLSSSGAAPSSSATPRLKGSAHSRDIFRKPAF